MSRPKMSGIEASKNRNLTRTLCEFCAMKMITSTIRTPSPHARQFVSLRCG